MVAGGSVGEAPPATAQNRLPPITELAVGSLVLIVTGGIYLAAYLPNPAPLGPPTGLLAAAGLLLVVNVVALARVREFAWEKFFLVARWALLAYIVVAGMLELVFLLDGTRGGPLVVLTLSLVVFAIDIPLILGFSVARYADVGKT